MNPYRRVSKSVRFSLRVSTLSAIYEPWDVRSSDGNRYLTCDLRADGVRSSRTAAPTPATLEETILVGGFWGSLLGQVPLLGDHSIFEAIKMND
jgi:hypothetical protein